VTKKRDFFNTPRCQCCKTFLFVTITGKTQARELDSLSVICLANHIFLSHLEWSIYPCPTRWAPSYLTSLAYLTVASVTKGLKIFNTNDTCGQFLKVFTRITDSPSKMRCSINHYKNALTECVQNATHFVAAISYARKMFMKLPPGRPGQEAGEEVPDRWTLVERRHHQMLRQP
jgi:hypothetical protein